MKEIESLYNDMIVNSTDPGNQEWDIHPEIKSRLHKKILTEVESLRASQRSTEFGSREYREIDCRIRRRVLKEIQIIIDAYVIALKERRIREWESMYGDIEHYKRDFFYYRMDPDYENLSKMLDDYKIIEK
jgi:hypothetical protein